MSGSAIVDRARAPGGSSDEPRDQLGRHPGLVAERDDHLRDVRVGGQMLDPAP